MQFKRFIGETVVLLLLSSVILFVQCGQLVPGGEEVTDDQSREATKLLFESLDQFRTEPKGVDLKWIETKSLHQKPDKKYFIVASFAPDGDESAAMTCNVDIWHLPKAGIRRSIFECADGKTHQAFMNRHRTDIDG